MNTRLKVLAAFFLMAIFTPSLQAQDSNDIELQTWSALEKGERRHILSVLVAGYFEALSRNPQVKHSLMSSCLADMTMKSLDKDLLREAEVDPEETLVSALIERLDCSSRRDRQ